MNIEKKLIEFNKSLSVIKTNKDYRIAEYNRMENCKEDVYTKKNILISTIFMSIYSLFSYVILQNSLNGLESISINYFLFIIMLVSSSVSITLIYAFENTLKSVIKTIEELKNSKNLKMNIILLISSPILIGLISSVLFIIFIALIAHIPIVESLIKGNFYNIMNLILCWSFSVFCFISLKKGKKNTTFDNNNELKKNELSNIIKVRKNEIIELSSKVKDEILKSSNDVFDFEYLDLVINENSLFEVKKTMEEAKKEFANKNNKTSFNEVRKEILSEKYHSLPIENI